MVVMDFVDGRDAYNEFKHRDLPQTVLDDDSSVRWGSSTTRSFYGNVRRPDIMLVKTPNSGDDDNEDEDVEEWRRHLWILIGLGMLA